MRQKATMTFSSAADNERGIALLSTVLAILLVSAIGMAMMYASNLDTLINVNYRDKQRAQYAAISGVQEARDRLQPVNVVARITAPLQPPTAGAAHVIYIINPRGGETVAPWDASNRYFDNELCQEHVLGLTGTPGVPCKSTAPGTWYSVVDDSQASSAPWNLLTPLSTKWTRIMRKANNMGVVAVNGDSSNSTVVCWDGTRQVTLPANYLARNCGPSHKVLSVIVTNAGNGYTRQPVITIGSPEPGGTQATAVARWEPVPSGEIGSIVVTNGGANYTQPPIVTITGGGGSGATAVAEIVDPGAPLKSLILNSAGKQCFVSAPSVSITGGEGSGATGVATVASGYNCIYSIAVGANCPGNDVITFKVTGGGGSGFSASSYATPKGGQDHIFSGLNLPIINPGTGYNGTPITVTATGTRKSCNGVTATATFGNFVDTLTLVNPGANYRSVPSVTLGGGVGSGVLVAAATATLDTPPPNSQKVTRVTITNPGSGYTTPPTVTFSGGGGGVGLPTPGGAIAEAQIGNVFKIIVGEQTMTNNGSDYLEVPNVVIGRGAGDTTGSGATAYATVDGVSGLTFGKVYQLTSLAVTPSGARALTQMEIATPVRGLALTGALTLAGPQPIVDQLPNSSPFFVDGTDSSDGSNVLRAPGSTPPPARPGCDAAPTPPHPAVGAYDDPNASTSYAQSSVDIVKNAIPDGRTNNYQGSGPSPDVQNVYGAVGDTLTSPTGMKALLDAVQAKAGAQVFPNNYDLDHRGPFGTAANPTVNFIDGDVTLQGNNTGYGILVVTGKLNMGGNFSWNGLVLVVGDGKVEFAGGGSGQINGQLLVSKIWDDHTTKQLLNEVGSPSLSWKGGGGNGIFYNHCWADDMLSTFPFTPPESNKQMKVLSTRTVIY